MSSTLVPPLREHGRVPDNPFAPRPPRLWPWILAATVVLALVAGVGVAVLGGGDEPPQAQQGQVQLPVEPAPGTEQGDGAPPVPDTSAAPADFTDADVTWQDLRGVRTPYSTEHGPFDVTGGRVLGFSEGDLGAVMAAVHLLARTEGFAGRDVYEPTIREQTTDTGYLLQVAERVNAERAEETGQPVGSAFEALAPTEVVGWRTRPGTGEADVDVVVTLGTTTGDAYRLASVTAPMVRAEGEWKLVAPATGTFDVTPTVDLAGVNVFPDARP